MNQLKLINHSGTYVVDSREVAEMVGKRHGDMLDSISGYVRHLLNGDFRSVDFFIKDSYKDTTGRELPRYLLTRKGCDMVANKMTGEKGVLFTAAYVSKFHEMEQQNSQQLSANEIILRMAQANVDMDRRLFEQEKRIAESNSRIDSAARQMNEIREIVAYSPETWRKDTGHLISKIARCKGGDHYQQAVRSEVYQAFEQRAHVDLGLRLENMKKRLAYDGASKTKISDTNKLDVIEFSSDSPKLIEIYVAIVKEMAIKAGVAL